MILEQRKLPVIEGRRRCGRNYLNEKKLDIAITILEVTTAIEPYAFQGFAVKDFATPAFGFAEKDEA